MVEMTVPRLMARRQHHHAEQSPWVGAEPRSKHAAAGFGGSVGRQGCQLRDGLGESALSCDDGHDDGDDAEEHDDALYEVVHGRCLIAAENDVHGGENGHDNHTIFVRYAEAHLEERRYAFIHAGGVGDEEHEGDDGGCDAQPLVGKARAEEVGHRAALDVLCHQLRTLAENQPGQERTDDGVAHANPR